MLTCDEYITPASLDEAFDAMGAHRGRYRIVAGATDTLPWAREGRAGDVHIPVLIDVTKIADLSTVKEDGMLRVGATAKLRDVKRFCSGRREYACLHDALDSIGKVQVMNMGTLGGNLCTASPAADSAPALLVLEAQVKLVGSQSERVIPLDGFFLGPNRTAIQPGEILSEIQVPTSPAASGNAFIKIARVAADISKISCAVAVERDGDNCIGCRIAMGAVAETPVRIPSAEGNLTGKTFDDLLLNETATILAAGIQPLTDVRSTEFYRKQVSRIVFKDTFTKAWNRAALEK